MTSRSKKQDKRHYLRIPKKATVVINKLVYPLNDNTVEAKTKNLSEKGICFSTPIQYPANTLLNLEIELHGWQNYLENVSSIVDNDSITKPLTAIGVVIWSKKVDGEEKYEVGVRFHDIYEDDYRAFYKYMDQLTKNT